MFQNPADGYCADRAHGAVGAARRRRNRQVRAFLKHERMTVAMNLTTVLHHSFMKSAVVEVGVQVGSPVRFDYDLSSAEKSDSASDETSSSVEYMACVPAVTIAPPDPMIEHATLAPVEVYTTPAPVIELMLAPVIEYIAPSLAISYPSFFPSFSQLDEAITRLMNPQFSITADETSQVPVVVQEIPEVQVVERIQEQSVEPIKRLYRSMCNCTLLYKLCTCQSLESMRSLKNIFLSGLRSKSYLNGLRSKSGTFLFLRSWKKQSTWCQFHLMSVFTFENSHPIVQTRSLRRQLKCARKRPPRKATSC